MLQLPVRLHFSPAPGCRRASRRILRIVALVCVLIGLLLNPAPIKPNSSSARRLAFPDKLGAAETEGSATAAPLLARGARGSQPFLTILCKFSDVPDEPKPRAYFEKLMGSTYPGLDHYWREVSYGAIDLAGSTVTGWHRLPNPRASYVHTAGNQVQNEDADLPRLAQDCVGAARTGRDSAVDLARYSGLNLVFNAQLGQPRGGQACLEWDGRPVCLRATWLFAPAGLNQAVWAHEMGHAFGLQHSAAGEDNQYGNLWDVMSRGGACGGDPEYGLIAQHPIAYDKDLLGWLPVDRRFVAEPDSQVTITLAEQATLPAPGQYLLARIPIRTPGDGTALGSREASHFYTLEARRRIGYDASLPADAVIIHEVDTRRSPAARLIDPASDGVSGIAARWTPGKVFHDREHDIAVVIDSATPTGFVVTIFTRALPPALMPAEQRAGPTGDVPDAVQAALSAGARVSASTRVDANGNGYAIWSETTLDPARSGETLSSVVYFAYRPAAGAWQPPVNVSEGDRALDPVLALGRDGAAYAAWLDYRAGYDVIYVARRPAGGSWSEARRFDGSDAKSYAGLDLYLDGHDHAYLAWEGYGHCQGGDAALSANYW